MIINGYTTTYMLSSVLSLSIGVGAASVGGWVAKGWKRESSAERQHALQKWVYLLITLANLGLFLRLFMAPLWFFTLHSLIPSLPGAMCLTGVHLANSPISFVATALKFLFPLLYGSWLIIDAIDRKIETQPWMKTKLIALVPIGILMVAESYADLRYLIPLHPLKVTCCTSLFDMPQDDAPQIIAGNTPFWTVMFYACFSALLLAMMLHARLKWRKGVVIFLLPFASVSFISFFLALHTHLSPLLLDAPFHHCVFCVWQDSIFSILFTALIIVGVWLAIIYAVIFNSNLREINEAKGLLRKLLYTSIGCGAFGWVILTGSILLAL